MILRPFRAMIALLMLDGCGTTYLSADMIRQHMAEYAVRPNDKAVFIIMDPKAQYTMFQEWSATSPEAALDIARQLCVSYAVKSKADPAHCVPMAVNDRQLYDPIPAAMQSQQDAADTDAAGMQMLQELSSLRKK